MPELPEVEIIKREIDSKASGQVLEKMTVRKYEFRWPVPNNLENILKKKTKILPASW